jgi:hypothetical protein
MAIRRPFPPAAVALLLFTFAFPAQAASVRTTNFVVTAPTDALARQFGDYAERYRKEKALEWLGEEMPTWPRPCPLTVEISMEGPSGATTFDFAKTPLYQFMTIRGPKERLLNSVLPHEITHTVFAHYFHQPVPRWADEGGAVLSEDDLERGRHDQMCRQLLNAGRAMRLNYLLNLSDYPHDVMVLYAQGFSISRYLVDSSDRPTFLQFVKHGMKHGWDGAVQTYYRYPSINDLERAWIDSLRKPRNMTIAQNTAPSPGPARGNLSELTGRSTVRTSNPPALPDLPHGTYRGSAEPLDNRFGSEVVDAARVNPPPPPLPPVAPPPLPIPLPAQPVRLGMPQVAPLSGGR